MIEFSVMKKILRAFDNKDVGTINSLLVQHYLNPNTLIPGKGISLMHLIIGHQSENFAYKIVKLFLRCGGDPNVQSSDGVTPTHVAAAWGRNRILHLLLVNGGDPWMQDDEKKNAFNYAFEEREWNTIEMLHHFHQMHSAVSCRQEIDTNPKFKLDLERVLLRKGEEMFAYAPAKTTKSMTTQTNSDLSDPPSSPVQEKIKYFEFSPAINCWKKPEKLSVGWSKDFYQTSCEVMVHCDPTKESEKEEKKKETFISSIHIDTSPQSPLSPPEKPVEKPTDVRGQLFVELKEAVRRRSKSKMAIPNYRILEEEPEPIPVTRKDSFVAKEVSYLYGIDLEDNGMLKNMSKFATKVMNEIEIREGDGEPDKTIDLCDSNADLTKTSYLSCENEESGKNSELHTNHVLVVPENSENSHLYLTPYASNLSGDLLEDKAKEEVSNESFVSVSEEYKYTDVEEGVLLLEKKLLVTPTISLVSEGEAPKTCKGEEEDSVVSSTSLSIPSRSSSINSDVLRFELEGLGFHPGPVTKTTKKLYLKKLWKLKKEVKKAPLSEKDNLSFVHSPGLEKTLRSPEHFQKILLHKELEEEMCRSFEKWAKRKWREGTNKTSFNYLLLDPRTSSNLPKRAQALDPFDTWKCFLSAIFYIGKGKRSRPYAHLYQAAAFWEKRAHLQPDEKTQMIMEIWQKGLGVVCLQVFQNIIPVEAFTREAAMIDALGLSSLKNARTGEYYGVASTWSTRNKTNLGVYLLYKAMLIFLNEGERQIKPYDID